MTQTAIVKPNQSSLDVVLMHCGTIEAAMAVMMASGRSITASLTVGGEYIIPIDASTDDTTLRYIQQNKVVIGTRG